MQSWWKYICSNKSLNELRRDATEKLIELRESKIVKVDNPPFNIKSKNKKESFGINVLVRNEDQLKASLELHVNNIYVTDYKLYKNTKLVMYTILCQEWYQIIPS